MRKFGFLLLFVLLSRLLFAQYSTIKDYRAGKTIEYLFTIGDTIRFFPINPDYSGVYDTDYPCFYDIECMESGIKPKYRFAKNKKKLTPKSEIENSYFYVKSICGYEFKKKNGLFFGAILERLSDHAQLCIAIPADIKKEPKESILNSWIVNEKTGGTLSPKVLSSFVIPFMTKQFIDEVNRLEGKTMFLFQNYYRDREEYYMIKFADGESKSNRLSSTKDIRLGTEFVFGKMNFISWDTKLLYSQPFLTITKKDDAYMYRIPVTHFAGNCNILYSIRGKIENLPLLHFRDKEKYIAELKEKTPRMDSLIGRTYYFNSNNVYYKNEKEWVDREVTSIEDFQKAYDIKEGFYKCIGFDYFPRLSYLPPFYEYYPIFEDNMGNRFRFPLSFKSNKFGLHQEIKFTELFEPEEKYYARIQAKADKEKEEERLKKKYGEWLGSALSDGRCSEERYLSLCKKYGKKKADWMARRIYDIGWTYKEFQESRNPIVKFECVHTYENKYAYYEVYDYGGTYITFKNGVIVSKSDYPSSNF